MLNVCKTKTNGNNRKRRPINILRRRQSVILFFSVVEMVWKCKERKKTNHFISLKVLGAGRKILSNSFPSEFFALGRQQIHQCCFRLDGAYRLWLKHFGRLFSKTTEKEKEQQKKRKKKILGILTPSRHQPTLTQRHHHPVGEEFFFSFPFRYVSSRTSQFLKDTSFLLVSFLSF